MQIHEPDEPKAIAMLRGVTAKLEAHHKVRIGDDAVQAAVSLSHRYIPARQLPDKAVSLLDTACSRVAMGLHAVPARLEHVTRRLQGLQIELDVVQRELALGVDHGKRLDELKATQAKLEDERAALSARFEAESKLVQQIGAAEARLVGAEPGADPAELQRLRKELAALQGDDPLLQPIVDASAVAAVVAEWTGIPVGRMVRNEIQAVLQLADTLSKRVIGQRHGLDAIARRIQTARAQLDNPSKPVGVFMLAGPSGVGKTQVSAEGQAQGRYVAGAQVVLIRGPDGSVLLRRPGRKAGQNDFDVDTSDFPKRAHIMR